MVKVAIGKSFCETEDIEIDPFENIYISGAAGTGKTTLANTLLIAMNKQGLFKDNELLIFDESRIEYTVLRRSHNANVAVVVNREDMEDAINKELNIRLAIIQNYGSIDNYNKTHDDKIYQYTILVNTDKLNTVRNNVIEMAARLSTELGDALKINIIICCDELEMDYDYKYVKTGLYTEKSNSSTRERLNLGSRYRRLSGRTDDKLINGKFAFILNSRALVDGFDANR